MINPTYPGVYVREESSGARAVAGVATSVTAFVGMTERGPLDTPKQIFNLPDYERNFGSGSAGGEMLPQVKLFFDNGGGEAFVTRIANGAQQATITVRDESGTDTLEFVAKEHGVSGNRVRAEISYDSISPESRFNLRLYRRIVSTTGSVSEENAEVFTNLSMNPDDPSYIKSVVDVQSELVTVENLAAAPAAGAESVLYTGLIYPNTANDARDDMYARLGLEGAVTTATFDFQIRIDQSQPVGVSVTLNDTMAMTPLATAIETAINTALSADGSGATINFDWDNNPGQSRRHMIVRCADHSFEFIPGTINDLTAPLMLTESQGAIYLDRFGPTRPAPNGLVSRVRDAVGANEIDRLGLFSNLPKANVTHVGSTHSTLLSVDTGEEVSYPPGTTMREGTIYQPSGTDDAPGSLLNIRENLMAIATALSTQLGTAAVVEVHGFRLVIGSTLDGSDTDAAFGFISSNAEFTAPPTNPLSAAGQIFDSGENLFNVKAYTLGQANGATGAGNYQDRAGATNGDDGNVPTLPEYRAAFTKLEEEVDLFNLMVLPRCDDGVTTQTDADRKAAFNVASALCAKERAFLLVDPPSTDPTGAWNSVDRARDGANLLRVGLDTKHSAVYWPRLKMSNGTYQDPSGAIAGLMARTDGARGVWKAAAGVEATIRGVAGVEHPMSDDQNGVLNPLAVNAIRLFPSGVLSWGARTLVGFNSSGDQDNKYSSVRRTMNFIEESLYRGLRFAVFEPNAEPLWAQIRLAAGSFMNGLYRQGAFKGEKASDAYYVLCDKTTTTATDINLGIVNVVVAFAPLKPAEFVVLTVKQIAGQAEV